MLNLAEQWGWIGIGQGADLKKLLSLMIDESDPRLPFGYIKMDEVVTKSAFYSSLHPLLFFQINNNIATLTLFCPIVCSFSLS